MMSSASPLTPGSGSGQEQGQNQNRPTAFITHPDMLKHSPHVEYESADRINEIIKYIKAEALTSLCTCIERCEVLACVRARESFACSFKQTSRARCRAALRRT